MGLIWQFRVRRFSSSKSRLVPWQQKIRTKCNSFFVALRKKMANFHLIVTFGQS